MAGRDAGRYHNAVAAPRRTWGARHVHVHESAMIYAPESLDLRSRGLLVFRMAIRVCP